MLERVISGGQAGADQGGLRAARACGIPTGGWAPRGWLTEAGPAPWLAEWDLSECPEGETQPAAYRARRQRCVRDCGAALIFGQITAPGSRGLIRERRALGKPWVHVQPAVTIPRHVVQFLRDARVSRLLIAGNRESHDPGIAARVERFLLVVFRSLAIS